MTLTTYINTLKQLCFSEGLSLSFQKNPSTIQIEQISFAPAKPLDLFKTDFTAKGILAPTLSPHEKEFCKKQGISFLTQDGSLYLVRKKSVLSIEPRKTVQHRQKRPKVTGSPLGIAPAPLVSPNAFAILDVLFRLPENQLEGFQSGLGFARQWNLYQPKLSILMKSMGTKTLPDLRDVIRRLSLEGWLLSLRYPTARRALTPFFSVAQPYHSLAQWSDDVIQEKLNLSSLQIAPGPIEVARGHGLIRDRDRSIWGTSPALNAVKKELRLIPGIAPDRSTWYLASPRKSLEQEALLSHLSIEKRNHEEFFQRANVFRAIWDLSYGGSRLAEIQVELLRRILG